MVLQKFIEDFILTYKARIQESVEHFFEFELAIIQEGLINPPEVGEATFDALFGRQFRQNKPFVVLLQIAHQILELCVSAVDGSTSAHDAVLDDGVDEILAELIVPCDLDGLFALDSHHVGIWVVEQELLSFAHRLEESSVCGSVFVDDVFVDYGKDGLFFLFLWRP